MKRLTQILTVFAIASLAFAGCGEKIDSPNGDNSTVTQKPDKPKAPTADFTYTLSGLEVSFTNTSVNATSYLWDFGDGTTSTEKDPLHQYSSAADYNVLLTVSNSEGITAKKQQTITVAGAAKAYFTATSNKNRDGKFGKIITLDATASENAIGIVWDFGDGTPVGEVGTEFTVNHEFPEYKTYKVKATVTGISGDVNVYETDVEVIAYNELLKGGSMELDDTKYWSVGGNTATSGYEPTELPAFVTEFGYKGTTLEGGKDGCLRLGGENQVEDGSYTGKIYQAIDVVEGDQIQISARIKWGSETADNGLFWLNVVTEEDVIDGVPEAKDANIFVSFFNWWSVGKAIPAYDGSLDGNDVFNNTSEYGFSTPEGGAIYNVQKTGKIYIVFEVRSVWGQCFGAGKDYFIDEVSAKIIL